MDYRIVVTTFAILLTIPLDSLPPLPSTDGTYTLKVVITDGIPVFSWVA